MTRLNTRRAALLAAAFTSAMVLGAAAPAQTGAPAPGAAPSGRPPAEPWWVEKTEGGVYHAPMRPLWKLADLKKLHPGKSNWQQQIIKDPEQDATYNSAAPGSSFGPRIHPDTPTVFVVVAGEVHFTIEGQSEVTATRGSIVNIMKTTVFSYATAGTQTALWVEVNPTNYKTLYPASGPQPKPLVGGQIVKVAFGHKPEPYTAPNQPHWNLFDGIASCEKMGVKVRDDHLFASPLLGYVNLADNKCNTGRGRPAPPSMRIRSSGTCMPGRPNGGSSRSARSAASSRIKASSMPRKAMCSMLRPCRGTRWRRKPRRARRCGWRWAAMS
jgi:mannose-6-phosphate isomerase-like protein (cupin superfamily)